MSIPVTDFLGAALAEIRSARAGDTVGGDDLAHALLVFNEYLDALNADDRAIYAVTFTTHTLTPSLQPHTIGLAANTPTLSVTTARPTKVIGANLVLTSVTPNVRVPITVRDRGWWLNVATRGITSTVPTDLYYSADWPNGSIYLWPVPTAAYGLELETSTLLAQVLQSDTLDLPPGYQQALRLTLAELIASSFGQKVSDLTARNAKIARARIWGNNDVTPNLCTRDAGMPGGRGGGFDYRTGEIR